MEDPITDIIIEPDDLLTKVIRYGLYFGAIFQIICIGAVIFIKDSSKNVFDCSDTESEVSPQLTPKRSYRSRRLDKKKKR